MNHRPFWFTAMAALFLMLAVSFPVQIMFLYEHGLHEWKSVLEKLTVLNWMVIAGFVLCAVLVYRAEPVCRIVIPLQILIVGVNNAVVAHYALDYSFWSAHMATVAFAVINLPILEPRVQWLLMNPESRWWLRAERKRITIPVTIEGTRLQPSKAETFDLSKSGAFVGGYGELGVGDWVTLRLKLGTFTQIRCQARVVRRTDAAGTYPAGIGIQFMNLGWHERRALRKCLERQHAPL